MKLRNPMTWAAVAAACSAAALSGCASPTHDSPIEERSRSDAAPPAPITHVTGAPPIPATPPPPSPSALPETRPLETRQLAAPEPSAPAAPPAPAPTAAERAAPAGGSAAPAAERVPAVEPEGAWAWPATGKLLNRFDETLNKGIDIVGSVGDPVWAANDGKVVYSGSSLHEYGKMIIIEHTKDYVSVYAHNNEILVTEGQTVKRGQRIAGLGMTDAPTPRLHFEIRRRGTPVDPLTYLPSR